MNKFILLLFSYNFKFYNVFNIILYIRKYRDRYNLMVIKFFLKIPVINN